MRIATFRTPALAVAGLAWCGALSAQSCVTASDGITAGPMVAAVHYDIGNAPDGLELGAEVAWTGGRNRASLQAYRVGMDGGASPVGARVTASRNMLSILGVDICADLTAGGSRLADGQDEAMMLAGGGGATVSRTLNLGEAVVVPFIAARGLAGLADGQMLDLDVSVSGMSLGLEGGASVAVGNVHLRAMAGFHGFAGGLGPTPYPARAIRLVVGWRF